MKAQRKLPAISTEAGSQLQATFENDPVVKRLRQKGIPVNRRNYLREEGYPGDPDPETEAMLPAQLQKNPASR
jgi:hypothetical protein